MVPAFALQWRRATFFSEMSAPFPALFPSYKPFPMTIVRGEGDRVFDADGRAWVDLYGGHCVCSTGHCHPAVVQAIAKQASELLFYSAAGEIDIRARAAEGLIAFAGAPMASVFFCNSGAEANENALKIAHQLTGRPQFAAFRGGWHGRSTLALSVTDDPKITDPHSALLAPCTVLEPNDPASLSADFSQVAAVILEPIQSMSGVHSFHPEFLRQLVAKAHAAGALVIFDEIQTGIGRLGASFAFQKWGIQPDMVTSAKGLASGVPMGATLMTEAVASELSPGALGSTFGGGPLACAALLATLQVMSEEGLPQKAIEAEALLRRELRCAVRGEGLLLGLEVGPRSAEIADQLFDLGYLVGKSSEPGVLRLMPPLNVQPQHLGEFAKDLNSLL